MKPIAIDLCCGLGGWTAGLLAEGWDVIGFDIEKHEYGDKRYPADLILKSILEINGYDLRAVNPSLVVASPPCQEYSYMAMPWSRAKQGDVGNVGGRVVRADRAVKFGEYVRPAVGRKSQAGSWDLTRENYTSDKTWKGDGGSWFNQAHNTESGTGQNPVNGCKVEGISFSGYGEPGYKAQGFNVTAAQRYRAEKTVGHVNKRDGFDHTRHLTDQRESDGVKQHLSGPEWFDQGAASASSKSDSRKAASAMIAEIPFPLAQHIARVFKPR